LPNEIESLQKQIKENELLLEELEEDLEADGDDEFWFWSIKVKIARAERVRGELQEKLGKINDKKV
jgi:hypothetical protein